MKKKDIILVIVVLLIAGVSYSMMHFMRSGEGHFAQVSVDGKVQGTYSLDKDRTIEIKSSKGKNILIIKDGKVEMKEADCPDKYCVKQGKIKNVGETIVCLPHKVVVEIEKTSKGTDSKDNKKNDEIDAVVK